MPPARGMLQGPRDHRATTLPRFVVVGGSSRIRALSLTLHPETPARPLQEEARSCRAGAGYNLPPVQRVRGGRCPETLPPALPCPALPRGQGGSDPQPPTGSRRRLLPPTRWALQTANQGLIFALERGLEAFRLQKHRAHVFGPAAGPSIPPMPARLTFPPAPASRLRGAASGGRMGTGG